MTLTFKTNAAQVARDLNLQGRRLRNAYANAAEELGDGAADRYKRATRTWRRSIRFEVVTDASSRGFEVLVGTDDQVFAWVDKGTRVGKGKYPIVPRYAKALRWFNRTPKTTPGALQSGHGRILSGPHYAQGVMHPGIKPRRFTEKVEEWVNKNIKHILGKHLSRWARRR